MGLYLEEDAKAGDWIARYIGDPLTKAECDRRGSSHYRLQVHKNLYLDAADQRHFEGRYINDARNSRHKINARFAANYRTNTCSTTGFVWVRIYATRAIKAGEEIFLDYGDAFWDDLKRQSSQALSPLLVSATTPISSQTSSVWAAAAYIPGDTPEHGNSQEQRIKSDHTVDQSNDPQSTKEWQSLAHAPNTPALLGYFSDNPDTQTQHSIQFTTPPSPITRGTTPHPTTHMNETYSFHQMYDLDGTILLPQSVTLT